MSVKLIWATPNAEEVVMHSARVSSPHQESKSTKLLGYLIKHQHWSPFEMASMCVEITTSRAISAQILRHRSFSFQEFSQRYAKNTDFVMYEARSQDLSNRQNSIDNLSQETRDWWEDTQNRAGTRAMMAYEAALDKGIAKECARMLLPMSTETKLYMSGTMRSFIHYCQLRCHKDTQLEHRELAYDVRHILIQELPSVIEHLTGEDNEQENTVTK
jgi:thymidylate synthase (FAD)